jgi:putative transposase
MNFSACWLNLFADVFRFLFLGLRSRSSLAAENLCLRKQLGFYQECRIKPRRIPRPTRFPYVAQPLVRLARRTNRRDAEDLRRLAPPGLPVLLAPEVPSWPTADSAGAPTLIRRMARENPSWGEERIANELLLKLGLRVSPRTVRKYWPKVPAAPAGNPRRDQRWSTFSSPRVPPIRRRGMTIVV